MLRKLVQSELQSFHLLFLNHALVSRSRLYIWGKVTDPYCQECVTNDDEKLDDFMHMFWYCDTTLEQNNVNVSQIGS